MGMRSVVSVMSVMAALPAFDVIDACCATVWNGGVIGRRGVCEYL